MTIQEIIAEAERFQFGEDGTPVDYAKAAYYYEQAAEQGDGLAQYNIGLKYYCGSGVEENVSKAAYWFKKAAAQGIDKAQEKLDEMKFHDTASRLGVSWPMAQAISYLHVAGKDGAQEAEKLYQEALENSCSIYFPTEEDIKERKQIFRGLGRTAFLQVTDNNRGEMLKKAYSYYTQGKPVTEDVDEYVVMTWLFLLEDLYKYINSNYEKEYYEELKLIYANYFSRFQDYDFRITILSRLIKEKCRGKYYTKDLEGAEKLCKHYLEFAQKKQTGEIQCDSSVDELNSIYDEMNALIHSERMTSIGGNTASSSNKSLENTPWKKFFPMSFGMRTLGALILRIVIYWVVSSALSVLLMEIPIIGHLIGFFLNIYYSIGIVLAIVQYVRTR